MQTKRIRDKDNGFIGIQLTPEILEKLDEKVAEQKLALGYGNRSQVIRMAIIEYLNGPRR